jgi:hypothetical protein
VGGGSVGGGSVGGGLVGGGSVGGGSVGGRSVFVGGGSVSIGGTGVTVGSLVLVGGIGVFVGATPGIEPAVAVPLGRVVFVGGIGVRVGEAVSVVDAVSVGEGEKVSVKIEVALAVGVSVPVAVLVGVVNIVANACIVSARSVLRVGVAAVPPVFGIMRSGSYSVPGVAARETMKGKPNANTQVLRRIITIKYSRLFNAMIPFVYEETFLLGSRITRKIISQFGQFAQEEESQKYIKQTLSFTFQAREAEYPRLKLPLTNSRHTVMLRIKGQGF